MELNKFYAGEDKAPFSDFEDTARTVNLRVKRVATLELTSGLVGAADPFCVDERFLSFEAPGRGTIYATEADVSILQDGSHPRIAYLSLIFSKDEPADILPAVPVGHEATELSEDHAFGVPVDAGSVSFFDSKEMQSFLNSIDVDRQEELRDEWIDELYADDSPQFTTGRVRFPLSDAPDADAGTLGVSNSGWGDGFYPVYKTVDAQGKVLGYHIDLQVVGE